MSPATAAERKAAERERKRAQGLVLKQVWVTPEAWPIIADLATQEAEEKEHHAWTHGGPADTEAVFSDGVPVSYVYELASEITNEILVYGEVQLGRERSPEFLRHVIRVMMKNFTPMRRANPQSVKAFREDTE